MPYIRCLLSLVPPAGPRLLAPPTTGQILEVLEHEGLTDSTLVHFTSDNGAWLEAQAGGEQLGGSNGVFRGERRGRGTLKANVRVPPTHILLPPSHF